MAGAAANAASHPLMISAPVRTRMLPWYLGEEEREREGVRENESPARAHARKKRHSHERVHHVLVNHALVGAQFIRLERRDGQLG